MELFLQIFSQHNRLIMFFIFCSIEESNFSLSFNGSKKITELFIGRQFFSVAVAEFFILFRFMAEPFPQFS